MRCHKCPRDTGDIMATCCMERIAPPLWPSDPGEVAEMHRERLNDEGQPDGNRAQRRRVLAQRRRSK